MPATSEGIVKPIHVEDIMTRKVVSVRSDHSIHLAAGIMRLEHIRHLPVLDNERLVGLLTHRDLLAAQARVLAMPFDSHDAATMSVAVTSIMRTNIWTVAPRTPVLEAARIILDHKFGCLPVLEASRVVGIVTEVDFIRYLVESLDGRRGREDTHPLSVT